MTEMRVSISSFTFDWQTQAWELKDDHGQRHDVSILDACRTNDIGHGESTTVSLLDCIPVCDHASILFTTRSRKEALLLVEYDEIIDIPPMSQPEAVNQEIG